MENRHTQEFAITCYDTDSKCRLKPSSFMDLAQEIAQRHAQILGFGYDDLIRTQTAWVLSRMHIHFVRYPLWRENVKLYTWHKGPDGLFYIRDFLMTDSEGNHLVESTSSWLVMDIHSRKLVRNTNIMDQGTAYPHDAVATRCGKLRMPKDVAEEYVGSHKVSFSDVDVNGHANNARYIAWVMDTFDYDFIVSARLSDMTINFNNEIHPGETVDLYRADVSPAEDGVSLPADGSDAGTGRCVMVEGRVGDKTAFCVELQFA